MDRYITKRGTGKKYFWIGGFSLFILLAFTKIIFGFKSTKVEVNSDEIIIGKVIAGKYQDYITVAGNVEPVKTVFIDVVEGGKVEEIFVEEGKKVKKGDVIMKLSNPTLLLEISNCKSNIARAVNDLKSARTDLENQRIISQTRILDLSYQLMKLESTFNYNKKLYAARHIPAEEYEYSKDQYELTGKQLRLLKEKYCQDSVYICAEFNSNEESIHQLQENLVSIIDRLQSLIIESPEDGEIASLHPETGDIVDFGSRIGSVNVTDTYKIKAEIDEHYLPRIMKGLKANLKSAGKEYELRISKIYPELKNGIFIVDLDFTGKVPEGLRIGQTALISLELSDSEDALLLPRGSFFLSTGGQWAYLVSENEGIAEKHKIRIGRQNPKYYEITEGLKTGDKVIISGYENFSYADKLILKNKNQ